MSFIINSTIDLYIKTKQTIIFITPTVNKLIDVVTQTLPKLTSDQIVKLSELYYSKNHHFDFS